MQRRRSPVSVWGKEGHERESCRPVADVGGGDSDPGRHDFEGGGCSAQLPDRVDEVGLAGPGRTNDDQEGLDVLRGSERVGLDDVFVAGSYRRGASKSTPNQELGHMWTRYNSRDPSQGTMSPPVRSELLTCWYFSCPASRDCRRWRCPSCQSPAPNRF